jgi:uncharacterized NAD-dependent epimerase/dehydratase family protein
MTADQKRRIVILTGGKLDAFTAKTAGGVIRYRQDEVVGVLDPDHAGKSLVDLMGVGKGIPIVASLDDLKDSSPDMLIIGVATPGGKLPDSWRKVLGEALARGMEVVNGLHTMLANDPKLSEIAAKNNGRIWDVRQAPETTEVGMARAASISAKIILTVGSDCNIGKKITAIEITEELKRRGRDAVFVATGQTGVMISGEGIAIDRVICDFLSGTVEQMVLEHQDREYVVVEGQGAIFHPSYSGVTLGLMHGSCPAAMVLCHQPTRSYLRHTSIPVPNIDLQADVHEKLMAPIRESKVVAVSLNCLDLSDEEAQAAAEDVEKTYGLPATDVVRFGPQKVADALIEHFEDP